MSRSKRAAREAKKAEREAALRRARHQRRLLVGVATAVAVAVVGLSILASLGGSSDELTGDTTPSGWELPALADPQQRVALADFAGTPTIAVFFASWCEVCENEIPGFATLSEQLAGQVDFVGINAQDAGRGLGDAEKWGIAGRWPLARDIGMGDGRGLATGTFGARGMPLTVIYDDAGAVVHIQRGGIDAPGLLAILQANELV